MNFKKFFGLALVLLTISPAAHAVSWKGIFIAGDDSIDNFDNGREDLTAIFSRKGTLASTQQLSSSDKFIGRDVVEANSQNLINAFGKLGIKAGEGCFIHMTSHGAKGQGFYLSRAGVLPPASLAALVNRACGQAPTVILVSACYSGQFISEELKGPNRVILTAARADRPSFGCSADTRYTYWDECVLSEVPNSQTWKDLYTNVNACISGKESQLGANPSGPQAYFGANTANWAILH
jgi:Peptidase C13 family